MDWPNSGLQSRIEAGAILLLACLRSPDLNLRERSSRRSDGDLGIDYVAECLLVSICERKLQRNFNDIRVRSFILSGAPT